jgi:hypothetical protein
MTLTPKRRRKRQKQSPAEKALQKLQAEHKSAIRAIFRSAGFQRVSGIADKSFTFDRQTTDIDDLFVFENIVIVAEYTWAQSSDVGNHLKTKKIVYDKISNKQSDFIDFIKKTFPETASELGAAYHFSKLIVKIIYCSRYDFDEHYKSNVPGPIYMDYSTVRYFAV